MKVFRAVCLALTLVVCCAPVAWGEGFALNEWLRDGKALLKTSQGPQLVRDPWGREE